MSFPLEPLWWNWYLLGIILMCLELLAAGTYLLWFGLGALVCGLIAQAADIADWKIQVLVFCACSLVSLFAGRKTIRQAKPSESSTLNRRQQQYLGRKATLHQPIVDGKGRIRLDDTYWLVRGPDLQAGEKVEIVKIENSIFVVDKADNNKP